MEVEGALLAAGAKAEATLRAERTRAADVFMVAKFVLIFCETWDKRKRPRYRR
jgi:hypothetical protein